MLVVAALATMVLLRVARSEFASPSKQNDAIGFDDVQRLLGCTDTEPLDPLVGPIRGGAANRGVSCTTGGATVHIFEAAQIGKFGKLDYRDEVGLGDINDPVPPACPAQVTVGRGLIIVSPSEEVARHVEDVVGIDSIPSPVSYPPASYELPC